MSNQTSQVFESYVPVFDAVPAEWDDAKEFFVERLKELANAINAREIGYYLDEELLSGKQLFPGTSSPTNQEFRSILRKVIDFGPLAIGANVKPHGITVDANFTLLDLYAAATDAVALTGNPINQPNITYDAININITATKAYTRCLAVIEYTQEI